MNWRNVVGIVSVAAIGLAVACCFRQNPTKEVSDAPMTPNSSIAVNEESRGRIVPLVVDDGFSGAAFIPAEPGEPSNSQAANSAHRTLRLPIIRRESVTGEGEKPPQLSSVFPQQLRVLGIDETEALTPAPPLTVEESEAPDISSSRSSTHIIADGDTLPEIARHYLGDATRAKEIYALNRDKLPSVDLLPIGVEIDLPNGK